MGCQRGLNESLPPKHMFKSQSQQRMVLLCSFGTDDKFPGIACQSVCSVMRGMTTLLLHELPNNV